MKRFGIVVIALAVALSWASFSAYAADEPRANTLPAKEKVAAYLQDISVTLKSGYSQGSGVTIPKGDLTFILTAGHVVDNLRKTREVVDPRTGQKRMLIEYDTASVYTVWQQDGERVGDVNMVATVITVSDADHGDDLALLLVKKRNYNSNGAVFFKATKDQPFPAVGTELYHCGSLLGQEGNNSVINGIVSQVGRVYENHVYDQTNLNIFPGSSGGGVYIKDTGEYCGMIVRGTVGGLNLMVPMRRIQGWAERNNIQWLLDPNAPAPSAEELAKIPIEDVNGFPSPTTEVKGGKHRLATPDRIGFWLKDTSPAAEPVVAPKPFLGTFEKKN